MRGRLATCVNHPDVETRIACSSCGAPICTRCMRQSAVGQKCPRCARPGGRARAIGKPVHYVRALSAGLGTALAGGFATVLLLAQIRFGRIILAFLVGLLVGKVVRWGASGQTQPPWPHIAAGCAAAGLGIGYAAGALLLFGRVPLSLWFLLSLAAAGYAAVRSL